MFANGERQPRPVRDRHDEETTHGAHLSGLLAQRSHGHRGGAAVSSRPPRSTCIHAAELESGKGGAGLAALHNADRCGPAEEKQAMAGLWRAGARFERSHRKACKVTVGWKLVPIVH